MNAQKTYIPDDYFELDLISLGYDDVLDDYVITSNISGITSLDIGNSSISDLTGIEDFENLTILKCNNGQFTSLDLSQNTKLTELICYRNQLTSLSLSKNTSLTSLVCWENLLSNLDLSQNIKLKKLSCRDNQLTSLDVSKNTSLEFLECYDNQLTSLDLSQNIVMTYLHCAFNQLTSLDISQKSLNLRYLYCWDNQITSLNVPPSTILEYLVCNNNKLTSLDVSKNTSLIDFYCFGNQLTSLNVKNGNNILITGFNSNFNPSLQCIEIDNETNANNRISPYDKWHKDNTSTYSEDCSSYLGVDDEKLDKSIKFYPNPVSNILSVKSETIPIDKIEIYSVLGQKIKEVNKGFNSISTDNLSRGIYIIRIFSKKGTTVRKLIKQ